MCYNKHSNIHLQGSWNKYGKENFTFSILCDLSWITELENKHAQKILDDCEILWIDYFGGANSNNTYNIREGGWGGKYSEEYCKHLSDIRKGKFSGKNNSMYGKCGIKSPTSKSVICLTTKRIFTTVTEGGEYYNISRQSVGKCCKGKAKYAGKYKNKKLIWRYLIWKHNKKYRVKEED